MPSSRRTSAWAAASVKVVSRDVEATSTSWRGVSRLQGIRRCVIEWEGDASDSLNAGHTFDNQVFSSESSSLVKAANIDPASEWDTERFGAEDSCSVKQEPY